MYSPEQQGRQAMEVSTLEDARQQLVRQDDGVDLGEILEALVEASVRLASERHNAAPRPGARHKSVKRRQRRAAYEQWQQQQAAASPDLTALLEEPEGELTVEIYQRLWRVPTAHAHVYEADEEPLVEVKLHNQSSQTVRVRVRSYVEGYSAQAVHFAEIEPDKRARIRQLPTFFPQPMGQVLDMTRATLHVEIDEVTEGVRVEEHTSFRIWLLPKTTAVLWKEDPATGKRSDCREHLVSWVSPNDPTVWETLREAVGTIEDGQIVGYQGDVEAQVRAFYDTLQKRGMAYVNSVSAVGASLDMVQRVRHPAQSLMNRSANCIDGAVLFASLFEAASLQAGLVVLPGHALVAWKKTRDPEQLDDTDDWDFLETTMMAKASFDDAVKAGRAIFDKAPDVRLIKVAGLRNKGYLPLA